MSVLTAAPASVELDPLELHTGILLGQRRTPPGVDSAAFDGATAARRLEALLISALERTPCLVAYSGGRDSSALLAAATHVARRHGLEDPVPATYRFPHHPRTEETSWQELTIGHVGLSDWLILDQDLELDVIGPVAQGVLHRHGLYWPPNAHSLVPLLEAASGGSLVTGNGGDELFGSWMWSRVARIRRARMFPARRDLRALAFSFLPGRARRMVYERLSHFGPPWLRPAAVRELRRRMADDMRFGGSWRAELELYLSSRFREVAAPTFHHLAEDAGTMLVEPFFDPHYVRAVAREAPREGFSSRTEAMKAHFGELLPDAVLKRTDKAVFTEVSSEHHARTFAEAWDGSGVDPSVADPDLVRSVWRSERPSMQSLTMLQAAYLASAR